MTDTTERDKIVEQVEQPMTPEQAKVRGVEAFRESCLESLKRWPESALAQEVAWGLNGDTYLHWQPTIGGSLFEQDLFSFASNELGPTEVNSLIKHMTGKTFEQFCTEQQPAGTNLHRDGTILDLGDGVALHLWAARQGKPAGGSEFVYSHSSFQCDRAAAAQMFDRVFQEWRKMNATSTFFKMPYFVGTRQSVGKN